MIDNVFVINQLSQIRELGTPLKFKILNELIRNSATCQQIADMLNMSKQKVHYNLQGMLGEGLIRVENSATNNKEVYYRARARNYILDFSMGQNTGNGSSNREILNSILQDTHGINLSHIAANLLVNSLKMKAKQRLLLTTGRYNLPLAERLVMEAGRRMIDTTLILQDQEMMQVKNDEYSLSAYSHDYEHFNKMLAKHDVFLNLNAESRYTPLTDPEKISVQQRAFAKSYEIIQKNGVKVAVVPGMMRERLTESDILTEINFWKALDVDYNRLFEVTDKVARNLLQYKWINIRNRNAEIRFQIDRVVCEYGSFNDSSLQSPIINLPGGKVLVVPRPGTLNGKIISNSAEAFGELVESPEITLRNNQIEDYTASDDRLITRAIEQGGADGRKVALIYFGTNYNLGLGTVDTSFQQAGLRQISVYWGDNMAFGGTVHGGTEWYVPFDNPEVTMLNE